LTEFIKIQTVEGVIAALAKTPYYPALAGYKGVLAEIENNLGQIILFWSCDSWRNFKR